MKTNQSKTYKGIGASPGVSFAKVFKLTPEKLVITNSKIKDPEKEIEKLENSLLLAEKQITKLKQKAVKKLGDEAGAIFNAHLEILKDPELLNQVKGMIRSDMFNATYSVNQIAEQFKQIFLSMDDAYMKERAADVGDVTTRIMRIIEDVEIQDLSKISEEVIIVAKDLTPSETSQLNKNVKGFVTEIGGKTSHSAIMARSLEIPAVVGMGKDIYKLENNAFIIINGSTGEVKHNPSKEIIRQEKENLKKITEYNKECKKYLNKQTTTKDGWKTITAANIGSPEDLEGVIKNGAEGVGLFRTEFLYMNSSNWPTEDEQYESYKKVLSKIPTETIVIRTLDIGGDKTLPYFEFPKEMNPFLGYRAIRLCLDKQDIFITQIRALLRASKFGKLAINIPMVATIEEFIQVKKIFKKVEKALTKESIKFGKYQLGIMVEVPSTVILAEKFAEHADFFSIGTNDLIQYTFAADRMSEKVAYLYQPFNPAILKLIKMTIDASHLKNKWTAICGELASEIKLIPIFVGMGLDEFSMSPSSILPTRRLISKLDKKECEKLVAKVINLETSREVEKVIDLFIKEKNIFII